jgi:hypothetical protein
MIDFRPIQVDELRLLTLLVNREFAGAGELRTQLPNIRVKPFGSYGSLELRPVTGTAAPVQNRLPIEGEFQDSGGITVYVLLFVDEGFLSILEIIRMDGEALLTSPLDHPEMIFSVRDSRGALRDG